MSNVQLSNCLGKVLTTERFSIEYFEIIVYFNEKIKKKEGSAAISGLTKLKYPLKNIK